WRRSRRREPEVGQQALPSLCTAAPSDSTAFPAEVNFPPELHSAEGREARGAAGTFGRAVPLPAGAAPEESAALPLGHRRVALGEPTSKVPPAVHEQPDPVPKSLGAAGEDR